MKQKQSKDSLGDRMKSVYENRTRYQLPGRTYIIIRIDGKAFHSYTKGLIRPFDKDLIEDMDSTAIHLCKNIMNCQFAYVQSDEISLLLTDFITTDTQAWFDNNLQKICSVSASLATGAFNKKRYARGITKDAYFDSRVFSIGSKSEVANYFLWRQQDATRNSISSVAQSLFSQKELHGVSTKEMQELVFQKAGINWDKYDPKLKRGRWIEKVYLGNGRSDWYSIECPIFNHDWYWIDSRIPDNG